MALILCPECNYQVSHQAEHCPHCGFPIRQYCAGELRPTPHEDTQSAQQQTQRPQQPVQQAQHPQQTQRSQATVSAASPADPTPTPEPPRNKIRETLKTILMLLVVVAIVAYFAVPYFTGTTPTDHKVIVGDSVRTPINSEYDIAEPAPQKKEEAKPQEKEEKQPAAAEPEVPSQRRDSAARPWIKMEPATPPTAKPENSAKPEGNAEKKTE